MPQKQFGSTKTYNQSHVEQLGTCTVRLRHKNKINKYGFFVVPGGSPALLGMPDMKLLNILMIMYEVVGNQQAERKLNSQTVLTSNNPSCNANNGQQI